MSANLTPEQAKGLQRFADLYAKYRGTVDEEAEFEQLVDYVNACLETQLHSRDEQVAQLQGALQEFVDVLANSAPYPIGPYGHTFQVESPTHLQKAIAAARTALSGAVADAPKSCNLAPKGSAYCDMCMAGHYERCRYVVGDTPLQITDDEILALWRQHDLSGLPSVIRFARALLAVPASAKQRCIGYPDCDGNLVATPHSEKCPLHSTDEVQPPGRYSDE